MKTLYLHRFSPSVLMALYVCIASLSLSATEYPAPSPEQDTASPCLPCPGVDKEERTPISAADRARATRELEELRYALKTAHEVKVALKGGGKKGNKRVSYTKYFPIDEESRYHLVNLSQCASVAEYYSPEPTMVEGICTLEFYDEQGQQVYRFDVFAVRCDDRKEARRLNNALIELSLADYTFYRDLLSMLTENDLGK